MMTDEFAALINGCIDPQVVAEGPGYLIAELVDNVYEVALETDADDAYLAAASYLTLKGDVKIVEAAPFHEPSGKHVFLLLVSARE